MPHLLEDLSLGSDFIGGRAAILLEHTLETKQAELENLLECFLTEGGLQLSEDTMVSFV